MELYIHYLTIGELEEYKKKIHVLIDSNSKSDNPIKDLSDDIKDKNVEEIWKLVGVDGAKFVQDAIKKIPYIGQILSAIDMLVVAVGSYLAIKPTLDRIIT